VQQDRLAAAQRLARSLHASVLLKGSGTVIASPGKPLHQRDRQRRAGHGGHG
jgi:NAD(P)H-hydrate repair Nnr-like enzyme with NAD(P)H-hydrate dehydratase domain